MDINKEEKNFWEDIYSWITNFPQVTPSNKQKVSLIPHLSCHPWNEKFFNFAPAYGVLRIKAARFYIK